MNLVTFKIKQYGSPVSLNLVAERSLEDKQKVEQKLANEKHTSLKQNNILLIKVFFSKTKNAYFIRYLTCPNLRNFFQITPKLKLQLYQKINSV